jgi:hypothetical protein
MKFGVLKSIGHNIAHSLACGNGFMIGVHGTDIYGEAAQSPEGFITVDFLTGGTTGAQPSTELIGALCLYSDALIDLCKKQGGDAAEFAVLTARFGTDMTYGPHFTVVVEDRKGRKSEEVYLGWPGKKPFPPKRLTYPQ